MSEGCNKHSSRAAQPYKKCYKLYHEKDASPHRQACAFMAWFAHPLYSIAILLPEGHRTITITKIIHP